MFSFNAFAEECKSSFAYREIAIDLGGDSKPEKIVYMRDTICEGSWMYCGSGGCSLEVFDDNGVQKKSYLSKNDWYIRPSETNYENPTENAFELIIPMSQSYCSENHGKENWSTQGRLRYGARSGLELSDLYRSLQFRSGPLLRQTVRIFPLF